MTLHITFLGPHGSGRNLALRCPEHLIRVGTLRTTMLQKENITMHSELYAYHFHFYTQHIQDKLFIIFFSFQPQWWIHDLVDVEPSEYYSVLQMLTSP